MSIDKKICPECNSKEVTKKEERNLLNLAIGLSVWTGVGIVADSPGLAALGTVFYFFDLPLGPDTKYKCNNCNYNWR